jgi:hypothetical protein
MMKYEIATTPERRLAMTVRGSLMTGGALKWRTIKAVFPCIWTIASFPYNLYFLIL